jgi:capsular exopolysaccharide synthesis family protein
VQNRAKIRYRAELETYKKEQDNITQQINAKRTDRNKFIATLPAGVVSNNQSLIGPQMMLTIEQISQFELFTNQLEQLVKIYSASEGPALSPDDKQLVEESSTVSRLVDQESSLELNIAALMGKFGPNHAQVRDAQAGLDAVRAKLNEERVRRIADIQNWKRDQALTQYHEYQYALMQAREKLADYEAQQSDLDRKIAEFERINEDLVLLRIIEERVNDYVREIERATREQQAVDVRKAQEPIDPIERTWPRWYVLPIGLGLALLLACGVAVLLELVDTSVRTPQDVVRHLTTPLLGTVPDSDDDEIEIQRVETAVRDAPHSMVAEAFRQIRANLQFSAPADRQRSLVITSPRPEDGKTTVASNLAVSLAQAARRILLVDANLRRPAIHRIFAVANNGKGLSNILIDQATLEECRHRTDLPNLDVLTTGPLPPNPAELLNGDAFRKLLEEATSKYDQVIFDAPPVLLASDALILATLVDGAVLVCRARENSRGIAQRALTLLARVNAHVFGAILNAAQVRRGGYFREQLRTFYDYQTNERFEGDGRAALPPAKP